MAGGGLVLFIFLLPCLVQCVLGSVRKFPEGFAFGVSTSAYQIEGAWNIDERAHYQGGPIVIMLGSDADILGKLKDLFKFWRYSYSDFGFCLCIGKSENMWDRLVHTRPELIADRSTGDIATDSYHLYQRDVEMLRELGVDHYRFSISWSRLLPTSFPDKINPAGVQYYNNLINELLKYNIKPMVTLYHADLPQKLQDLGGWTNPEITTWFSDYARVVFELFGDRVKYFITINEPWQICYLGYGQDILAPAASVKGFSEYLCAKNILVAHAKAYHIYDKEFRASQKGNVSVSWNFECYVPATDSEDDIAAANDAIQFNWLQYMWPIFSETGDFSPELKKRIAAKSAEQGFPRSRLPEFTSEEIELMKGTSDYIGVNHYGTYYVYRNSSVPVYDSPSFDDDLGVATYQSQEWLIDNNNLSTYTPWGITLILDMIRTNFKNPPVMITENGYGSHVGLEDDGRVTYLRGYLDGVLDAIDNGSDVRGYTVWSIMDNMEWSSGYSKRYGMYEVDFEDTNRTRTPRKSAYVYRELLRTRQLDQHYEPDLSQPLTIAPGR